MMDEILMQYTPKCHDYINRIKIFNVKGNSTQYKATFLNLSDQNIALRITVFYKIERLWYSCFSQKLYSIL